MANRNHGDGMPTALWGENTTHLMWGAQSAAAFGQTNHPTRAEGRQTAARPRLQTPSITKGNAAM